MKGILVKIHPKFYIFLSGILIGLSLVFAEMGIISYIALVPLFFAMYKRMSGAGYSAKKAYLDGFLFYTAFYLVAFHWITYFYPLDFAGIGNIEAIGVILLGWFGLSALQSAFSALVFVLVWKFIRTTVYQRYPILLAPIVAALFAINEWTQTFTWAGVPWGRIAISQTEMPILMQSASLFGSYFLTFIVVLVNVLIAFIIICPDKRRKYAFVALSVFLFNLGLGTALYFVPAVDEEKEIKVASVQGNSFYTADFLWPGKIFEIYSKHTRDAVKNGAELIIWPEGTFALDIHDTILVEGKSLCEISILVSALAKELGVTIALGSYCNSDEATNSSMSVFYPDGTSNINAYAKRRPVPFGEFLPFEDLVFSIAPVLAQINVFSSIDAGESSTYFYSDKSEDAIKVGTLICFDSIYEQLGIDSAKEGAEILIITSNDSWFFDSRALNMHHAQNILRAVEQRKYTINCANTGISSIVNYRGEVINQIPIETEGYIIDSVYASNGRSVYSYIGNLFVYTCVAALIAVLVCDTVGKKKFLVED